MGLGKLSNRYGWKTAEYFIERGAYYSSQNVTNWDILFQQARNIR
jgi:hypothetical protein